MLALTYDYHARRLLVLDEVQARNSTLALIICLASFSLASSGCSQGGCTEMGCENGLHVNISSKTGNPFAPGEYLIEIVADGSESAWSCGVTTDAINPQCTRVAGESGWMSNSSGTAVGRFVWSAYSYPSEVTIRVSRDGSPVGKATLHPTYQEGTVSCVVYRYGAEEMLI